MEALIAQDRRDVLQPGHRVAQLGPGQPVDGAGGRNGVDGLPALEPDRVEVGQVQVRDQLWHEPPCPCVRVSVAQRGDRREVSGSPAGRPRAAQG